MLFYYSIFSAIFVSFFFVKKRETIFVSLLFIFLFFILSFIRWETGTDWKSYKDIFEGTGWVAEFGFRYFNLLIRKLTDNYSICLLVQSVIIFLCLLKPFKYFSVYPLVTLMAFFCLLKGDIFFTRQYIAVNLCLLAAYFLCKNEIKYAFGIWCFAFIFHYSSIAFSLAFFIYKRRFNLKTLIIILFLSVVFSLTIDFVISFVADINKLNHFLLIDKFLRYYNDSQELFGYGGGFSKQFIVIKSLVSRSLILFVLILCRNKFYQDDKFNLIFNFYIVDFCLFCVLSPISFTLTRLNCFFSITEIFCYSYFIKAGAKFSDKVLIFLIVTVYLGLRLYSGIQGYYDEFVPFKTIFSRV